MSSRTQRNNRRRGQALIETSLVLLLCMAVMVGILDVGRVLFIHQFLTERVRLAARYASVNTYDATKVRNIVLYGKATPADGAKPYMNLKASNVVVTRSGAGTADDRVSVRITGYPFAFFTEALLTPISSITQVSLSKKAFDIGVTQTYEHVD
jgi:hypothetical protein